MASAVTLPIPLSCSKVPALVRAASRSAGSSSRTAAAVRKALTRYDGSRARSRKNAICLRSAAGSLTDPIQRRSVAVALAPGAKVVAEVVHLDPPDDRDGEQHERVER